MRDTPARRSWYRSVILSVLMVTAGGCGVYRPNAVNPPMLSHAGQLRVAGSRGFSSWDAQAALSPLPQVGIMANVATLDTKKINTPTNSEEESFRFKEIGLGYYRPRTEQRPAYDLYGLFGWGSTSRTVYGSGGPTSPTIQRASYRRIGLQADWTTERGSVTTVTLTPRLFLLLFNDVFDSAGRNGNDGRNNLLADLTVTLQHQLNPILATRGQLGINKMFSGKVNNYYKDISPFFANVGFVFTFGPRDR